MHEDPKQKTRPLSVRLTEAVINRLEAGLDGLRRPISEVIRTRVERDLNQDRLYEMGAQESRTLGILRRKIEQGGVLDLVEYLFLAERAHNAYLLTSTSTWHDVSLIRDNLQAFAAVLAHMSPRHRRDLHEPYFLGNLSYDSRGSLDTAVAKILAEYGSLSWTYGNPEMRMRNLEVVLRQVYAIGHTAEDARIAEALAPYGESLFVVAAREGRVCARHGRRGGCR